MSCRDTYCNKLSLTMN